MLAEMIVLRLIHVLCGTLWVGMAVFTTVFLFPAVAEAGPAGAPVIAGLQKRKLMVVMPVIALLTILSGLRLIWIISGGFDAEFFASPRGQVFSIAGGLAIVAFLYGILISRPRNVRMGVLGQRMATASPEERGTLQAEMQKLRSKAAGSAMMVTILVVVATVGMAIARYL